MSSYVRPVIAHRTFTDADGTVIEYGNRWTGGSPPTDSYSVDAHPERFAPLHTVALALVDHLQREYRVEVTDDLNCADDLARPHEGAVRALRVVPAAADAAPMTLVFTDYPGIVVHAGLLHDFLYPICGCEACDETWDSVADDLERTVLAVAAGRYREEVGHRDHSPWVSFELTGADGSGERGGGSIDTGQASTLGTASARLRSLPGGIWAPWPARATP